MLPEKLKTRELQGFLKKISILLLITLWGIQNTFQTNVSSRELEELPAPTIDGIFNSNEGWQNAENAHCAYLIADEEHIDNYNYIYTLRVNGYLYVLVDLCSDNTDDAMNKEWVSLWIDSDNSKDLWAFRRYFLF